MSIKIYSPMKEELINPFPDNNCFFCGSDNDHGLKLKFFCDKEKGETYTEYLPASHFVGQGNILHGSIQMGLLDEIMGWTSHVFTEEMAVTSDLNIQFLKPTYICERKIFIKCSFISRKTQKVKLKAELSDHEGNICTIASGLFHVLPSNKYKKIVYG